MTSEANSHKDRVARWSRRRIVAASAATVALGGVAASGAYLWWRGYRFDALSKNERTLALALSVRADRLGLDVADTVVERWVQDYVAFGGTTKLKKGKASRKQVESLLMSSDLFAAGRDPQDTRVRAYVAHYNPHKNPCFNPLRNA